MVSDGRGGAAGGGGGGGGGGCDATEAQTERNSSTVFHTSLQVPSGFSVVLFTIVVHVNYLNEYATARTPTHYFIQ